MAVELVDLLRAYARMLNSLSYARLAPVLHSHFQFASQAVFSEVHGKQEFLEYMKPKLEAIAKGGSPVFAEMGSVSAYGKRQPCVILAQGTRENLVAVALGQEREGRLARIDLCIVPSPAQAVRTGEYPA